MTQRLFVYGATGYTGGLIVRKALDLGLDVTIGGRRPRAVEALARELDVAWHAVDVDDVYEIRAALAGIDVVFNAAAPYRRTAPAFIRECVRAGVHYLDACAELDVLRSMAADFGDEAKSGGSMVMQGVGFSVMGSEFLALHLVNHLLPNATWLRIALSNVPPLSAGSALTAIESIRDAVLVYRNGRIELVPLGRLERKFDFDLECEPPTATAVNLADTYAAYLSTSVPNIESYTAAGLAMRGAFQLGQWTAGLVQLDAVSALIERQAAWLPKTLPQAFDGGVSVLVEAEDYWRQRVAARLDVADTYRFTARAAAAVSKLALDGVTQRGYCTPGEAYCDRSELATVFETAPVYVATIDGRPIEAPPWVAGPGRPSAPRQRAPAMSGTGTFVDATLDPQIPPPYVFDNVTVRGFKVAADLEKLEDLCAQLLQDPYDAKPPFKWRPATSYILIEVLTYPSMRSESGVELGELGGTDQHELLFRLLVGKAMAPHYSFGTEVAMFCPYIFVDNVWSMISGREIIGYPKLLATFQPANPTDPVNAAVETHVFEARGQNRAGRLAHGPLLEILPQAQGQIGASLPFTSKDYAAWLWQADELNKGFIAQKVGAREFTALNQALTRWQGANQVGTVQLMQFRDGRLDCADQARVRNVVEGCYTVRNPTARLLGETELRLYSHRSLKIAETLGLQGRPIEDPARGLTGLSLDPVIGYTATCDMRWEMK